MPNERTDGEANNRQENEVGNDQELVKATFYITQAQVIALEELRLQRRKQGEKTDKSELIRQAIDLLIQHSKQ